MFQYCRNSPLFYVDPDGEISLPIQCGIGAGLNFIYQYSLQSLTGNQNLGYIERIKCIDLADMGATCIQSMVGFGMIANGKKVYQLYQAAKVAKMSKTKLSQYKKAKKVVKNAAAAFALIQAGKSIIRCPVNEPDDCDEE